MVAQQQLLDVVANNLANVNTPGFKASDVKFHDLMYQRLPVGGEFGGQQVQSGDDNPSSSGALRDVIGGGVKVVATGRDFQAGKIEQDDDPLHAAIQGVGFFVVQTPDGGAAYTRDGNFSIDAVGRLVTANGDIVLPETRVPADAHDVRMDSSGLIYGRIGDADGGEVEIQLGEVQLARFTNPSGLVAVGQNLFMASEASGPALIGYPEDEGYGSLRPGATETSNVDLGEQMTTMLMGQRAYSFSARALQTMDEMLGMANNLRR
jgi:flagellar basal-body rod protein FlgG